MSKYTDVVFDIQNISLNKIYSETNQEEKKQRILKQYKKKYWDSVFEEAEKIFRKLVSKNYKEKSFFNQVRRIKKRGFDFFKSLLELDIPERYNTLFFAQIVMYEDDIYNCETDFVKNTYGRFCLQMKEPMFIIKEYRDELKCDYFLELTYKLGCIRPCAFNLGFYGDSTKHTEEDFWKLYDVEKAYVEFDYLEHYGIYLDLESIFLK